MIGGIIRRLQHNGYIVTRIFMSPAAWAYMYKDNFGESVAVVYMGYVGKYSGVETYIVDIFDKKLPLEEQVAYMIKEA